MAVDLRSLEGAFITSRQILLSIQAVLFLILLIAVSVRDISKRMIPDGLQIGIAALSLLQFQPWNLLGILSAVPYLAVALCCRDVRGIGGGDVKLAGALGMVLGLSAGLAASVIGLCGFVLFGMGLQAYRRYQMKENKKQVPLPLGPFLAVGAAVLYFMKIGEMML